MESGADRPQEDEFAICALGAPSPYESMAFPNLPRPNQELIDMKEVDQRKRETLARAILFFARSLTARWGKRLLFKSPTHTGRIEFLRQLFPGAKFLHISRDPASVIPSTVRLWTRLDQVNGFQIPRYDQESLEKHVGETFERMYRAFDQQTDEQNEDVYTLRYESIVENPVEALRQAYDNLQLEGFEQLEPKIRNYMQDRSDYRKNQHSLNDGLRQIINHNCREYQEKYGYPPVP